MTALPNKALDSIAIILATSVVVSERLLWPLFLFALKSIEKLLDNELSQKPLPELRVVEHEHEYVLLDNTNNI